PLPQPMSMTTGALRPKSSGQRIRPSGYRLRAVCVHFSGGRIVPGNGTPHSRSVGMSSLKPAEDACHPPRCLLYDAASPSLANRELRMRRLISGVASAPPLALLSPVVPPKRADPPPDLSGYRAGETAKRPQPAAVAGAGDRRPAYLGVNADA